MIEKDVDRVLFKPFEIFICNNQNSDKIIEELKQLDDPPILCGHVFKSGEPSYFCRLVFFFLFEHSVCMLYLNK